MLIKKFILLFLLLTLPPLVFGQIDKEAVNQMFAKLSKAIEEIDPEQVEKIPYYSIQIAGIHKDMDSLQLILQKTLFQPIAPEGRKYITFSELSGYFKHLERVITEKMSAIDLVFYEGALESLSERDSLTAEKRLRQSIQYNPSYSPSLYALVRLLISRHRIPEAEEFLLKALSKVDTANNIYYAGLWKRASNEVFSGYLRVADLFMKNDDYLSAIQQTANAEALSLKVKIPGGKDSIQAYYSFAHDGMFLGYLRIAQRAIDQKKWDLANIYLEKTTDYQREHKKYILSGNQLTEAYEQLEKEHLISVKAKEQSLQYQKSKKVSKYRKQKRKSYNQKKQPQKIQPLQAPAKAMADSVIVMDTLVRDSVVAKIHSAYFLVWKNQLDTARLILDKCLQDAKNYRFENDREYQNASSELIKRINERYCFSIHSEFDILVSKAFSQINRQNYVDAGEALNKARRLFDDRKDCLLSDSLLNKLETRYKPLIAFTELNEKRSSLLIRGEYAAAYSVSRKMAQFVTEHPEESIRQSYLNTEQFIRKQSDQNLTKAFLQASIDSAYRSDCLLFMQIYKEQNRDNTTIRDEQVKAAHFLADYDYHLHPVVDAGNSFESLNLSSKWYRFFKTAYLKRYKELQKAGQKTELVR